jgi:hypothetical protein
MSGFELTVVIGGAVVHSVAVGGSPLRIGRAQTSELVLDDDSVSWHHAQVWVEGGRGWIQDLASRNGTYVNDQRIRGAVPVAEADNIRVGNTAILRLRGDVVFQGVPTLQLEDLDARVRFPLRSDRFHIGSDIAAHLRLPDGPGRAGTIGVHPDGELWLGTESGQVSLAVGVPFELGGRRLRVVQSAVDHAPTVEHSAHRYPYEVVVNADGPSGPEVVLSDPDIKLQKLFTRNRGLLLYVLARKLHEDRAAGAGADAEGWCNDTDVAVAIWGRSAADANKLHVLIHRLRKAVSGAGFDPWFVEKRQWGVRVRLHQVTMQP